MPSCICIPCSNRKYAVETIKRPDNGCFGKEDSTVFTIFLLNSHQFDRMYINVRDTIYRNLLSNILRFQVSWRYLNILLIFHCKFPWNSHAPIWITIYPYSRASSAESTISGCTRRSFVTKWTVSDAKIFGKSFPILFFNLLKRTRFFVSVWHWQKRYSSVRSAFVKVLLHCSLCKSLRANRNRKWKFCISFCLWYIRRIG